MTHYYNPYVPGDNMPEYARTDVVAAEQRILTYADALLTWMRKVDWESPENRPAAEAMDRFFTHTSAWNPAWGPSSETVQKPTQCWIMDKLDHSANQIFMDLLRACWERRNWRARYGEITELERE